MDSYYCVLKKIEQNKLKHFSLIFYSISTMMNVKSNLS